MLRSKIFIFIVLLTVAIFLAESAFAQSGYYEPNMFRKLGRGALNVLFGWCEFFIQPSLQTKPYEVVIGIFKGVGYAAGRTLAGVYEVATFPIPIPWGYEPVVEPEFVFGEHAQ